MIKLDVVVTESFHSITGVNQVLRREVMNHDFFLEKGIDSHTFTLDDIGNTPVIVKAKNKNTQLIKILKGFARSLGLHSRVYSAFRLWLIVKNSKRIVDYYHSLNRNPDVIVFHSVYDSYQYLKKYGNGGKKIVQFIHADSAKMGMAFAYFPKLKGTFAEKQMNKLHQYVVENVDKVVSISEIGAKNFVQEFPQIKDKVVAIVNGIEDISNEQKQLLNEMKAKAYKHKYRLVSSGSINGRKGQWIIVHAMAKLNTDQLRQISLTLVGDGPERKELETFVKEHNLSDNVSFTGAVNNDKVFDYLISSNIYVLMSSSEGLPISIIEGLRCGLPVIATNVAGIPETVIDHQNGLLINRDVDELASVLANIDNYDWEEFGKESRKHYENKFTYLRMREGYANMINSLMQ